MRAAKPSVRASPGAALIRDRSIPLRSMRSPCGSPLLIGILHTEIAKVAKIDLELGDPMIGGRSVSFAFYAISVWMVFSDRITHRDRKGR
jgi:hypothetical protein